MTNQIIRFWMLLNKEYINIFKFQNMMRDILDVFFFIVYKFQLSVGNKPSESIMMTFFGIIAILLFNLLSFLAVIGLSLNLNLIFINHTVSAILIFLVVSGMVFLVFLKNKRYNMIIEKYTKSNKKYITKSNFIMIGLLLFTLLNVYYSLYIIYISNKIR